jgi:oligosaccharyltransferase complex subunit beta
MVIDHTNYAVTDVDGDHTLIAGDDLIQSDDDLIQSDVILGSKRIEVSCKKCT